MKVREGKVHDAVREALKERGIAEGDIEIVTFYRGPEHLVILNGETIGDYNHVTRDLRLYADRIKA
jgi:hypothetical protein